MAALTIAWGMNCLADTSLTTNRIYSQDDT